MVRHSTARTVGKSEELVGDMDLTNDRERVGPGVALATWLALSLLGWAAIVGLVFMVT